MYDDKDLWPFKCPTCGEEFTEEIGRFKAAGYRVRCPKVCDTLRGVGTTITSTDKEFGLMIAEAQKGSLDPWRGMLRIGKGS